MYDLIVVGGGPAGLSATVYAIRKRLNVLLISPDLGGKTNFHSEAPGGDMHPIVRGGGVVEQFRRELDGMEFVYRPESVTSVDKEGEKFVVHSNNDNYEARAIIFATGARTRRLNVPGEREFIGRGVTYSAITYAPSYTERCAVVVGNGKLAWRATAELSHWAAAVHLISPTYLPHQEPFLARLNQTSNVVIWEAHKVKAIEGHDYVGCVRLEAPDGREAIIETEGVFVEMGLAANSEPVKHLATRDEEGRIRIDSINRTGCPGLFAAGDVTNTYAEQVLIAIGEGAKAALSAGEHLLLARPPVKNGH